mgnify:CR=1 FL=1
MKDGTLAHLLPAARKQAELGSDERILGLLCDRWIDYPRATQALQQLEESRLHGDIERARGLVRDAQGRTQSERSGDAARWRWPPESSCG